MNFSRDAVLFRNNFCTGPTCSPSRVGLLTGRYPHQTGMLGLAHRGFAMEKPEEHLSHFLANNGYETVLAGIQHEADDPSVLGYSIIIGDASHNMKHEEPFDTEAYDIVNAQSVSDYLHKGPSKPFFLSVGMFNTHRPFPASQGSVLSEYVSPPSGICDTPQNRRDTADYIRSAAIADRAFGMVYNALKTSGLLDETVVLFTTDHGIAFPGMKCNLTDGGMKVAQILRIPGHKGGRAIDELTSHLDIFPTLCEIGKINEPDWLEGTSLLPLIRDGEAVRSEVFSEISFHAGYDPQRAIRTKRYKYIRKFDPNDLPVRSNVDDCPAKTLLLDAGYYERAQARNVLFDLVCDPQEMVNLSGKPEYVEIEIRLRDRLEQWMSETDDPLCAGHVERPQGTIVNSRRCVSPVEAYFE
jgi:arylsulfatase A-like enzyme